jgi:hypothetical protein
MKTYRVVEVFLTSALNGWASSCPSRLSPGTHWVGPRTGLGVEEERQVSIPVLNGIHIPNHPARSLVTIVTELSRNPYTKLTARLLLVGSEVLIAVIVKSSIFWDITPCSPLKVSCLPPVFNLVSSFDPEDEGDMILRNVG